MRLVYIAWRSLRRHRLRNFLTGLTMLVGVLALVVVSAVSVVASDMMIAAREQADGRKFTYETLVTVPVSDLAASAESIQQHLAAAIKPGWGASVVSRTTTAAVVGQDDAAITVEWLAGDITLIRRLPVLAGTASIGDEFPPRLMLNEAAAALVGYPDTTTFQLQASPDGPGVVFGVSAVVADGASVPQAYGSIAAMGLLRQAVDDATLVVRVTTPDSNQDAVRGLLSDVLVDCSLPQDIDVHRADTTWQVEQQVSYISSVFQVLSVIMLAIAVLAILNVGLSSVREESRELVVRRALGARRVDSFLQVIIEQVLVAAIVSALAIVAALAAVYVVLPLWIPAQTGIVRPGFPWPACVAGIAAALATAVAGSVVPAWKASRLAVTLALRE